MMRMVVSFLVFEALSRGDVSDGSEDDTIVMIPLLNSRTSER
jgi:hypothetical protein